MFIYTIQDKNNLNEIYVGQTKSFETRCYHHKRAMHNESSKSNLDLYRWMRSVGEDNLLFSIECECSESDARDIERKTVKKYESLGYNLHNKQLTANYSSVNERFNYRDEVYDMSVNQHISDDEISSIFGISKSLIWKILSERNFHRKSKLFEVHKEIQQKIINGVPLHKLAREYGVCKSAIRNINNGNAFYDSSLDYPLNQHVREKNLRDSWFKSKV